MAKPTKSSLSSEVKKRVVSLAREGKGARVISNALGIPRYQVMFLLESKNMAIYSEGSYN